MDHKFLDIMTTTMTMSLIMVAQMINILAAYHQVAKGVGNPFYEFLSAKQKNIIIAVGIITAAILNILAGVAAYGEWGGTWKIIGIIVLAWNVFWAFGWLWFVQKYGHRYGLTTAGEED